MLTHFDQKKKNIYDKSTVDWDFAKRKSLIDRRRGLQLTHTRPSSATYFGADGLLKVAPVNLILWSESFEQAAWSATGATVTSNVVLAPDGAVSADKLIGNNGVSTRKGVQHYPIVTAQKYTYSVYLKAAEFSTATIWFDSDATIIQEGGYYGATALLNLSTGVSSNPAIVSMTSVGNGWYRCVVSATYLQNMTPAALGIAIGAVNGGDLVGDGVKGIYVWGAQLETGSTATDYIRTTSTINSAPRFDHDPITGECRGLLIEEQKTNLLLQSENFSATWTVFGATVGSSVVSPSGATNAQKVTEDTSNGEHRVTQLSSGGATTNPVAVSFFAKAGERTKVRAAFSTLASWSGGGGAAVVFDLAAGTATPDSSTPTAYGIIPLPNGWYRCFVVGTPSVSITPNVNIFLMSGSATIYTGNGTSGVYLWGVQLELGGTATSVIPTTTAAVSRVADNVYSYLGRTNLCLQSETFGTTWTTNGASVGTNAINDPLGQLTADALIDTAVNETHYFTQAVGAQIPGLIYTFSCYMKKGSKNYGYLLLTPSSAWAIAGTNTVYFDLLNGAVNGTVPAGVTAAIVDAGNGWYRCSLTAQCITTSSTSIRVGAGSTQTYTGAGDAAIYVWGAQFEISRTATAYLATTSLAVTNYADSWYNANAGSWMGDVYRNIVVPANEYPIIIEATSPTRNAISQFSYVTSTLSGIYVTNASVVQAELYPNVTASRRKIAFSYALDDFFTTANAGAFLTDTAGTPPTNVWQLNIGSSSLGAAQLNGTIKRLTYFAQKLPNATAWGLTK